MGTISASSISDALARARSIGLVEEDFTILDCALVLRNLRPDEYSEVMKECQGLEDVDYLTAYQKGHLSRSIVEVNGVDLRGVDFIEIEETDPKTGETRIVKLEKHAYLEKNLLASWGKEAVFTAYRKFQDVVSKAEELAVKGIEFIVPDETPEEKYRRLIGDLKEIEGDVPSEILTQILEDAGFMRMSTAEELKAAMDRTDQISREQETEAQKKSPTKEESPSPDPTPSNEAAQELMRERQPMNQSPGQRVPDPHQTLQKALESRQQQSAPRGETTADTQEKQEATKQPSQTPQQAPQPPSGEVQVDKAAAGRAAQIAALEQDAGTPMEGDAPAAPAEVPELREGGRQKVDPKELAKTIDRPPTAGINPRYKPPPRA